MSAPLTKPHEVSTNWRRRVCSVSMPGSAVKVGWTLLFGPQHGISYASQERISDETGVDRGDVGKILREFLRVGLIEAVDAADLAAALRADGQPKADKRLVGYRRLLDPDVALTADLVLSARLGKAIAPSTEVRLKARKPGAFKAKIEGTGTSEAHPLIEGAGPSNSDVKQLEVETAVPPEFWGDVPTDLWGDGAPPYEPQDSGERDGVEPSPQSYEQVESSVEADPDHQDSAPSGAVLSDDDLYQADLFFGELFAPDRALLALIKLEIGPQQFSDDLQDMIAAETPFRIADWAATYAVRHAA